MQYPDLILDDGKSSVALYVRGRNFGRLQDVPLMHIDEQGVEVLLGNATCDVSAGAGKCVRRHLRAVS